MRKLIVKALKKPFTAVVFALIVGFILGTVALAVGGYDPVRAYNYLFTGVFSSTNRMMQVLVDAVPIIFTGLAVAFAGKTGLFNIGADGQFILGQITGAVIGYYVPMPPVLHPVFILLCAFTIGGVYAGLASWLKNRFGIHEVISTIMLNWIAYYFMIFIVNMKSVKVPGSQHSPEILSSAKINFFSREFRSTEEGMSFVDKYPLLKPFVQTDAGYAIILMIGVSVLLWVILKYTRLGYELRAVGYNRFAAEFAAMPVKRNAILSMFISGGVSATGGALLVMSTSYYITMLGASEGYGWDGIAVALIAGNHPIGCIFAGLLYAGLKFGG
ncbi:MAG TPA: ABC transporter permease, partial [Bacillota bacterium]|nr:ABC transporter permease [Bacillota bacterium]